MYDKEIGKLSPPRNHNEKCKQFAYLCTKRPFIALYEKIAAHETQQLYIKKHKNPNEKYTIQDYLSAFWRHWPHKHTKKQIQNPHNLFLFYSSYKKLKSFLMFLFLPLHPRAHWFDTTFIMEELKNSLTCCICMEVATLPVHSLCCESAKPMPPACMTCVRSYLGLNNPFNSRPYSKKSWRMRLQHQHSAKCARHL